MKKYIALAVLIPVTAFAGPSYRPPVYRPPVISRPAYRAPYVSPKVNAVPKPVQRIETTRRSNTLPGSSGPSITSWLPWFLLWNSHKQSNTLETLPTATPTSVSGGTND